MSSKQPVAEKIRYSTPDPSTGYARGSSRPFDLRGLKTPPSERADAWSLVTPAQEDNHCTFFQSRFLRSSHLAALSFFTTQVPCLQGGGFEIYSPISFPACLASKQTLSLRQTSTSQRFGLGDPGLVKGSEILSFGCPRQAWQGIRSREETSLNRKTDLRLRNLLLLTPRCHYLRNDSASLHSMRTQQTECRSRFENSSCLLLSHTLKKFAKKT
ncbi:uncharacterized protein AAG666_009503 [Megaptera novaeangliae]